MFTIISIIILILSWYLFRKVCGSMKLTQLNMVSWIFYVQLIALSFIASILVVNGWVDDHQVISCVGEDARFYGWLSVQYTMIAMPLSMLFINYLYGYESNSKLFLSYINSPVITLTSQKDSFVKYPLYILSLISLLSVVYTFISSTNIPIVAVFQGWDAHSLSVLRQKVNVEFKGINFIKNIFGVGLTPILSYVAYAYWRLTKLRKHFIWFLIMFVFSCFIVTFDLGKAPFVLFIIGFLFLNVLINGGVKKRTLYLFIGVALILLVTAYVFVAQVIDFNVLYSRIATRIIMEQAVGTYLSFEYFPYTHDFIGLSSLLGDLLSPFGMNESEIASRIIVATFSPSDIEDGTAGVMNSLFIQEAWANFGLFGVILAPIYVGMFVQIIYMFFLKSKKTPIMLGLLACLSYKMPITSGINQFLINRPWLYLSFILISVYVAALFLKGLKRNMQGDL